MSIRESKHQAAALFVCALLLSLTGCSQRARGPLLSAAPPSAATAEHDIYLADTAGRIRALRPDGTTQWSYSLADELVRSGVETSHDMEINYLAAGSDNELFGIASVVTGPHMGRILLFALKGNTLAWQKDAPRPEPGVAPLAVSPNAVYEAGDNGMLYAFARADGRSLWQYRVSGGALSSPIIGSDGTIYVTGPRHNLHAISPDGAQRWIVGP